MGKLLLCLIASLVLVNILSKLIKQLFIFFFINTPIIHSLISEKKKSNACFNLKYNNCYLQLNAFTGKLVSTINCATASNTCAGAINTFAEAKSIQAVGSDVRDSAPSMRASGSYVRAGGSNT